MWGERTRQLSNQITEGMTDEEISEKLKEFNKLILKSKCKVEDLVNAHNIDNPKLREFING